MQQPITAREHTILLVSDDAALRATARRELETIDERRRVASVNSVGAAPAVILLDETARAPANEGLPERPSRLDAAVSSLASYAPVVVIGDAEHQTELSGLVAAGAADYVVRTEESLTVALGLVERRLRKAQNEAGARLSSAEALAASSDAPLVEIDPENFGELLRHELNNPLTGILGNAELLLSEIRRKDDGRLPGGAAQRLETIAALAVRLRETVRRLSQEWEARRHALYPS